MIGPLHLSIILSGLHPPKLCKFLAVPRQLYNTVEKTKTMTIAKTPPKKNLRLVTFETLVTFLTIEDNNLNIQSDP